MASGGRGPCRSATVRDRRSDESSASALIQPGLVDQLVLPITPVVVGTGKRLFAEETPGPGVRAGEHDRPGYHMNKRHWNTVELDDSIDDEDVHEMIEHSYEFVVKALPRRERDRLPPPAG